MTIDEGVPYGPGYSAEPEPSCTVSAVPVSIPNAEWLDQEFCDGYRDGRDRNAPEPSNNRSAAYRPSFIVARAELASCPIPADISRKRADEIEQSERTGA